MLTRKKYETCLVAGLLVSLLVLLSPGFVSAQAPARGTITGTVSADQGQVQGFRVTAHNLRSMIWYVVFTRDGKYTVPQALRGPYEISVLQDGYDSPLQKTDPSFLATTQDKTPSVSSTTTSTRLQARCTGAAATPPCSTKNTSLTISPRTNSTQSSMP